MSVTMMDDRNLSDKFGAEFKQTKCTELANLGSMYKVKSIQISNREGKVLDVARWLVVTDKVVAIANVDFSFYAEIDKNRCIDLKWCVSVQASGIYDRSPDAGRSFAFVDGGGNVQSFVFPEKGKSTLLFPEGGVYTFTRTLPPQRPAMITFLAIGVVVALGLYLYARSSN